MDNKTKREAAHSFATVFAASLTESVAKAIGSPWPLEVMDCPNPPTSKDVPIHFRLALDGAVHGECFVEFYEPQVSSLVATIKKEPAEPLTDEHRETMTNIIASAMSGLAESLSQDYGSTTCKVDPVAGLAFGGMLVVSLTVSADVTGSPLLLYFDGQLLESLAHASSAKRSGDSGEPAVYPINLKLVMDVELNVSLRFGQRQLPLREVLELGSGSVIELDRMVDEPVELLLDGKLIARGEAVIVDGNYGLRVTDIPRPLASNFLN